MNYNEKLLAIVEMPIGFIREALAYEDGDTTFADWLAEVDMSVDEDEDIDDYDDCEDDDYWDSDEDDYDDEDDWDEEDWDEEEEIEEEMIEEIVEDTTPYNNTYAINNDVIGEIINDIRNGAYSLNSIRGIYPEEVVNHIASLI